MQSTLARIAPSTATRDQAAQGQDWLAMDAADLDACRAEAAAMLHHAGGDPVSSARYLVVLALLDQITAARALVQAGCLAPARARTSLRGDRALGYLFGLAACSADQAYGPARDVAIRRALRILHDLTFGEAEAARVEAAWSAGAFAVVGDAFGDGLLAAEADIAAFGPWLAGQGGSPPQGLLDGLPCPGWARQRAESACRH